MPSTSTCKFRQNTRPPPPSGNKNWVKVSKDIVCSLIDVSGRDLLQINVYLSLFRSQIMARPTWPTVLRYRDQVYILQRTNFDHPDMTIMLAAFAQYSDSMAWKEVAWGIQHACVSNIYAKHSHVPEDGVRLIVLFCCVSYCSLLLCVLLFSPDVRPVVLYCCTPDCSLLLCVLLFSTAVCLIVLYFRASYCSLLPGVLLFIYKREIQI